MESSVLLKWLLIIGGIIEIFLGAFFIFIHLIIGSRGVSIEAPIFPQIAGCVLICFGYLLIYTTKDVGTYSIIPKMNILLRFLVLPAAIYNVIVVPDLGPLLIGAAIYDITWAIIVLLLLKKMGYFMASKVK